MRTFAALAFVVLGLGSFGPTGCGGSACDDAHEALCRKACQCGACKITSDAGASSIGFDSEDDCVAFFGLVCDNDDTQDWDRCAIDVATTECKDDAAISPASCG